MTVFAAASLSEVVGALAADWGGAAVVVSAAGSATLARQIQLGAPADIFISANTQWMQVLVDDGTIRSENVSVIAGNTLVLAGPKNHSPVNLPDLPAALGTDRLAVALVDAVPAGIYAKQALVSLGLWPQLSDKLAQTDNVRAALALVSRGETPLGIVYASDVTAAPDLTVLAVFPAGSHDAIVYPAGLVGQAPAPSAADFLRYLGTDKAAAIFAAHGFAAPPQ